MRFVYLTITMLFAAIAVSAQQGPDGTLTITNPADGATFNGTQDILVTYSLTSNLNGNRNWVITSSCTNCIAGNGVSSPLSPPPFPINTTASGQTRTWSVTMTPINANTTMEVGGSAQLDGGNPTPFSATPINLTINFVLPVEIISFDAKQSPNGNILAWQTATELNNEAFLIEKSLDGKNYQQIGKVDGAGTSFTAHNYFFVDEAVQKGIAYYRLKQIDFDGTFEYSDVVSVFVDPSNPEVKVYPNPSADFAYLSLGDNKEGLQSVNVINSYGSVARTFNYNGADLEDDIQLDLSGLQSGSYYLQMIFKNKTTTERISKL